MKHHTSTIKRAGSLTETLFSLEEPWRSRFLNLLANYATGWKWNGQSPTQEEVASWLGDNILHQEVTLMLTAWQRG